MQQGEDQAWLHWREKFSEVYDNANYASPLQNKVMEASHTLTERPFGPDKHFGKVLEVGAGTGAHLPFVRHTFDTYTLTDLDPKTLDVARTKLASIHDGKKEFTVQSGGSLDYADNTFDRVVATHVLEHIPEPHLALKEWARVTKKGGVLSILIPTDPGIAWRLGRHFGPRRNAIAQGFAYDYIMAREHVNSCTNLLAFLTHYFPKAVDGWWPFPIPSIDMNLFYAYHATVEKDD